MKIFFISLILVMCSIVLSCSSGSTNYPYQYVDAKTENYGVYLNKMELYAFAGAIDKELLKDFCRDKSDKGTNSGFHYIVIFDDVKNATFPKNPMTAEYGVDENAMKHIRVFYTYNRVNRFSELRIYEKNQWESAAIIEKI